MELEYKFERMYQLFSEKAPVRYPVFQAAKIAEETGEAIKLVFKLVGFRREEYDIGEIRETLGEELADVVITTFVCAKECGVDLWRTLERKLDVEIDRWENFETVK